MGRSDEFRGQVRMRKREGLRGEPTHRPISVERSPAGIIRTQDSGRRVALRPRVVAVAPQAEVTVVPFASRSVARQVDSSSVPRFTTFNT